MREIKLRTPNYYWQNEKLEQCMIEYKYPIRKEAYDCFLMMYYGYNNGHMKQIAVNVGMTLPGLRKHLRHYCGITIPSTTGGNTQKGYLDRSVEQHIQKIVQYYNKKRLQDVIVELYQPILVKNRKYARSGGMTLKQIAGFLGISINTVYDHTATYLRQYKYQQLLDDSIN